MTYYLYTDGGSRGNPGNAAIGFLLFEEEKLITFDAKYLGTATNNQAEYEALILGLTVAEKQGIKNIICYMDSELVVKQINGEYKAQNPNILPLYKKITKKIEMFKSVEFIHVKRALNKFADKLVNIVLDATS